ncbi:MAG: class I SAM-dependent methyltransferase [Solirubrobacteraceae bacterium]
MSTEREVAAATALPSHSASAIIPPPGVSQLPAFDRGWVGPVGAREPFLSYIGGEPSVNWSDELEALHEEGSRTHFLDRRTRQAIVRRIDGLAGYPVIADLGCSTGYLLEDLRAAYPPAQLIGVDLIASGLRKAHAQQPDVRLLQADVGALPLADASIDAVVSANLLEHVPDDSRALQEIARVLRRRRRAVIVVPAGAHTYDYYDRFLGHERRYARGELAAKAADAGLDVLEDFYIGSLLYPAFWLVKQRNRRRYDTLRGAALEQRVSADIVRTKDSRVGELLLHLEDRLLCSGARLPFGIRSVVVAQRPGRD